MSTLQNTQLIEQLYEELEEKSPSKAKKVRWMTALTKKADDNYIINLLKKELWKLK